MRVTINLQSVSVEIDGAEKMTDNELEKVAQDLIYQLDVSRFLVESVEIDD